MQLVVSDGVDNGNAIYAAGINQPQSVLNAAAGLNGHIPRFGCINSFMHSLLMQKHRI